MNLKKLFNNTLCNIIVSITKSLIDLLFIKYCIEKFGNDEYSEWVIIIGFVGFIKLIDLGTNQTLILSFVKQKKDDINSLIRFKLILSFISILGALFFTFSLYDLFNFQFVNNGKLIVLLMLFSQIFYVNICGPLNSLLISKEFFIRAIITNGIYILIPMILFLSFRSDKLIDYAYFNLLSLVIVFILQYNLSGFKAYINQLKFKPKKYSFDFSTNKAFLFFNIVLISFPFAEIFIIKNTLGNNQLIDHIVYFRFPLLFSAFLAQLMTNFFPAVSKYSNRCVKSAIIYINKLTKYLIIFSLICSMLMFFYLNTLIYLWMGDKYNISYQLLFYIHIIIFFESIIFSLLQIILPFNPKLFKISYFIIELSIRSFLIMILHYTGNLSYEKFLFITLICKCILCLKLINSYKIIEIKNIRSKELIFFIPLFFIYIITYYFYQFKIQLFFFYLILSLIGFLLFFFFKSKLKI